ncbi:MAG TPA: CBS domain-containing protein [Myxococcota bacterium]|nr:CBS domain-containing protein [Myxococcota bacterium]
MQVRDVMSPEVATVRRGDKLVIADDLMSLGRIRHTPVLGDGDRVVGILSQRDLFHGALARAIGYGAHAKQKLLTHLTVEEVMTTDPITTTPETPLSDAARVMLERKIGCLPVVERGKLVGILTEGDFVRLVLERRV